jgi:serine protease Do
VLPGDVVVEFDRRPVDSTRQLLFMIAGTAPGTETEMMIIRDGRRETITVRPVEWVEEESGEAAKVADLWLGMEVASLDGGDARVDRLREALGVAASTGVMVVDVQDGHPAAEAGIRPGDVLLSIGGHQIADLESFAQARTLLAGGRDPLTVLVKTGNLENYVTVTPRPAGVEN